MKLACISDLHLRFLPPEKRLDANFFEDVVMAKFTQLYEIASSNGCKAIIQAGDIVDTSDVSKYVISRMMQVMRNYPHLKMYSCLGQHDISMRNFAGVKRTSVYLLEAAGLLKIVGLDGEPVDLGEDVLVHGLSFEQDFNLPEPVEGKFNILVAHATVGDKPLYPGHELPGPKSFVRQHKGYRLVCLGDIHYSFRDKFSDCQIYNTGVMIRKSISEKEQRPNVIIYDTETRTEETVYMNVKPWQEVFQIDDATEEVSSNKLQEFIAIMKKERESGKEGKVTFNSNLLKYYECQEVATQVKAVIASAMERVGLTEKQKKEISHGG